MTSPSLVPAPERLRQRLGLVLFLLGLVVGGSLLFALVLVPPLFQPQPLVSYGTVLLGALLAFPAAAVYLTVPRLLDMYAPEPWYALVGCFLWGALAAAGVSALVNSVAEAMVTAAINPRAGEVFTAVVSAPLVEETTKGIGLLGVFLFLRTEFDGVVDGVIYGTFVALGFAASENIIYYAEAAQSGADVLAARVVGRGILSPWVHPLFTVLTGFGLGISRETHRRGLRALAPGVGLAAACVLHALWNGTLVLSGLLAIALYPAWIALVLAYFLVVVAFVIRRGRTIRNHLVDEVAIGTLNRQELELVCSPFGVYRARRMHGTAGVNFVQTAARLALSKWHTGRAVRAEQGTISMQFIGPLREKLRRLKQQHRNRRLGLPPPPG